MGFFMAVVMMLVIGAVLLLLIPYIIMFGPVLGTLMLIVVVVGHHIRKKREREKLQARKEGGYMSTRALVGLLILAVVLFIGVVSVTMVTAHASTVPMCPMPKDCTTPQTMNSWYVCDAKLQLKDGYSSSKCAANLKYLDASPSQIKVDCKK